MLGDERDEALAAGTELVGRELGGPRGGPGDEVGDPDAAPDEVGAVVVGHARATVDRAIDHARSQQRRIEAVAGMGEVGLRRGGPQTGVDPDEQQPQPRTDEVGHDRVAVGLELGPREAHGGAGYGLRSSPSPSCSVESEAGRPRSWPVPGVGCRPGVGWYPARRWETLLGVETELVEAAQAGDQDALAAIVDDFMPTVLGAAYGLCGDWDAAGDVAQETFATMVVRLGDLRDAAALPGWLMAIVRSCARRQRARRAPTLRLVDEPAGPEEIVLARDDAQRLRLAVEALSAGPAIADGVALLRRPSARPGRGSCAVCR